MRKIDLSHVVIVGDDGRPLETESQKVKRERDEAIFDEFIKRRRYARSDAELYRRLGKQFELAYDTIRDIVKRGANALKK